MADSGYGTCDRRQERFEFRMTDFFFKSVDLRDYSEKHACTVVGVVDTNKLKVMLSPPIPSYV